jgi:hypothetical protein
VEDAAIMRMVQAGAIPMTWCGAGAELMGDWRSPHGQEHAKLMGDHLPFAGNLYASFAAAKGPELRGEKATVRSPSASFQ